MTEDPNPFQQVPPAIPFTETESSRVGEGGAKAVSSGHLKNISRTKCLLGDKHCAKCFTDIISFTPQSPL